MPSLRMAFTEWMRARAASGGVSTHTRQAYELDVAAIARIIQTQLYPGNDLDAVDVVQVSDLTLKALRDAFAEYADGRAISTLSRAHSTFHGLASFCVEEGWLAGDPMSGIKRPRVPAGTPKPLRGGEETTRKLLEHLSTGEISGNDPWRERDFALIATLLTTAVRASELRGLTRGGRYIHGGDEHLVVLGKGNKERAIPILPPLSQAIDRYDLSRQERFPDWKPRFEDPLFVNATNEALTKRALEWIAKRTLKDAGLSAAPERQAFIHGFRHHWATTAAANGASATELQAILGHASLNTSQNYIRAVGREVRATAASNPAYQVMRDLDAD